MKTHFYNSSIESDFYDHGGGIGFGSTMTWGSPTGIAGIVGLHMDVQYFEYQIGGNDFNTEIATYAFDLGVQYHKHLDANFVLVPWAKYSTISGYTSFGGSCNVSPCSLADDDEQSLSLSAMALGMDIKFNDFSLGAMYQSSEETDISSLSLSYNF